MFKGLSAPKAEISVNPPDSYGNRFFRFISGLVKSPEEALRDRENKNRETQGEGSHVPESAVDGAHREREGADRESDSGPSRISSTIRSPSTERSGGGATILPIVEETAEGSTGGRSLSRNGSNSDSGVEESPTFSGARRGLADDESRGRYTKPSLHDRQGRHQTKYQEPEEYSVRVAAVST